MAEGGCSEPGKHVEGSDQEFLHVCDCCQFEGTESEAVAFCVFCTDYLCDICLRVHKKTRATREHEILEGDAIKEAQGMGTSILAMELCDHHKDKKVTFYCSTHDEMFCDICKSIYHRKCPDVKTTAESSASTTGAPKEPLDFLKDTKSLVNDLKALETKKREALTEIAEKKTSCLQEIKKQRTDIDKFLDQIEKDMEKKVSKAVEKESDTISNHLSNLENAIQTLEAQANNLEKAISCGQEKAFIAMKRIQLPKLRELLQDVAKEKYQEDIEVTADLVQSLQGSIHHLCQVKVHTAGFPIDDGKLIRDNVKDRDLKMVAQYNVNHPSESWSCDITGCQVLPNGDFLLCDYNNSSLKILNLPMWLTSHIQLPERPYDVSLVSLEEAVVTLPEKKEIQFVSLKPKLALGERLAVGEKCWGVVYSRNQLYVASGKKDYKGSEVLVLNLQGQIQTRVNYMLSSANVFGECTYITITKDITERTYTTARQATNASCFNKDDKLEYDKNTGVKQPGYILTDTDQNAYICGANSKLQMITHDGQPYRTLLQEQPKSPTFRCMAYRSSDKTLLVGKQDSIVNVYRFV